MGIGLIIAGLVFLFVPSAGVYDFMPDFIGYLLILWGLRKLSPLDGNLQAAKSNFVKLFFFDLLKNILVIPLISLNDETTFMLVTFAFAVVEMIFLLSASGQLLEGLYYLSSRADSKAADRDYSGTRLLFRVFTVARAVLVSIPELTVMTSDEYQSSVDIETNALGALYTYRSLIFAACFTVSAVIGVVFIVKIIIYLNGIRRDGLTVPYLKNRYDTEVLGNAGRMTYSAIRSGLVCTAVGMFFMTSFLYYGVDVIPDFIGIAAVAVGFGILGKVIKKCRKYAVLTGAAAVVSAGAYALNVYVATEFYHATAVKTDRAVLYYTLSACGDALSYIVFAAVLTCLGLCLYTVVCAHTCPPSFRAAEYVRSAENRVAAVISLGLFCCVAGSAVSFLYIYSEAFWLVGAAVWLIFAVIYLRTVDGISDEAEKKYM